MRNGFCVGVRRGAANAQHSRVRAKRAIAACNARNARNPLGDRVRQNGAESLMLGISESSCSRTFPDCGSVRRRRECRRARCPLCALRPSLDDRAYVGSRRCDRRRSYRVCSLRLVRADPKASGETRRTSTSTDPRPTRHPFAAQSAPGFYTCGGLADVTPMNRSLPSLALFLAEPGACAVLPLHSQFRIVFDAIRELMTPPAATRKRSGAARANRSRVLPMPPGGYTRDHPTPRRRTAFRAPARRACCTRPASAREPQRRAQPAARDLEPVAATTSDASTSCTFFPGRTSRVATAAARSAPAASARWSPA